MNEVFKDKVVLITGGASGIGAALGRQLKQQGARVWLADLADGPDCVRLDVTDRKAFRALVERIVAKEGRLDLLFNNAGVAVGGEVRDYEDQDWRQVIEVNLYGVINGVQAAYPVMIRQKAGHIVNTASVAGLFPLPAEASYTAAKHAVVGLSRALRAEAVGLGVRVSVVCPGVIQTPIYQTNKLVGFDRDKVLKLWPRGITAEQCAKRILQGVRRNQATIVVTAFAQFLDFAQRMSPVATAVASRMYMRLLRRTCREEQA